jgi:2-methylaconitate cis-trans-isomerase PrpF
MWIGNVMLVILNLPLVGLWVAFLKVPYRWLYPLILVFSCIGIYTVNMSASDIAFAAFFGLLGYIFLKLDCEPAPFILGFLLGPMIEENFRRAMLQSHGNLEVFVSSPLSAVFLAIALGLMILMVVPSGSQAEGPGDRGRLSHDAAPHPRRPHAGRHEQGPVRQAGGFCLRTWRCATACCCAPLGARIPTVARWTAWGGGHSSASKVAVISRSKRPGCDIDYLFGQVAVDRALIDWSGSCGNLLSAAASFAIDEGFVDVPSDGVATVRIWQVNLGQQIVARVPVRAGQTAETGSFEMDGVAFAGAEILIEYPPQENADGGLFPTGRVLDRVEVPGIGRFDVTLVQAGMATAIVEARVLGLDGTELPEHINGDDELLERLEMIRAACAVAMGLAKTQQEATQTRPHMPKLAFVSPCVDYRASNGQVIGAASVDLVARIISMGKLHHAITGTGAAAIAAALQVAGTVPPSPRSNP